MQAYIFLYCLGALTTAVLSLSSRQVSSSEAELPHKEELSNLESLKGVLTDVREFESRIHPEHEDDDEEDGIEESLNDGDESNILTKRGRLRFVKKKKPSVNKRRLRFHSSWSPLDQRNKRTNPGLQSPRIKFTDYEPLTNDIRESRSNPKYSLSDISQSLLESSKLLERAIDEDDFEDDDDDQLRFDKKRLRFNKRRLRFNKRPLRFNKRPLRFNKRPLRSNKRRLRFNRRNSNLFERESRFPRLRFIKKRSVADNSQASPLSRKRRSIEDLEVDTSRDLSKRRPNLSINNALILLTDMIIAEMQEERQRELAELRQRMIDVGKRSVDSTDSEGQGHKEMVRRIAALLA